MDATSTDIRSRLADALGTELTLTSRDMLERLADVLLSLPGIAIVELPEPNHGAAHPTWFTTIGNVLAMEQGIFYRDAYRAPKDDLHSLAAALLAAVAQAENHRD